MISTSDQKVNQKKFNDNFDNIFGEPTPVKGGSFVQTPDGLKPKGEYTPTARVNVHTAPDFVSPIDGQRITSNKQLDAHNTKHGVTNSSDYSDGYIARKAEARNKAGEKHIKETRRHEVTSMVDAILRQG